MTLPVRKVLVHVEDNCTVCGKPYLRMGLAALLPTGHVADFGKRCGPPHECSDCRRREADESAEQAKVQRRRNAWVKKHAVRGGKST
jgi:hypothetical protein